MAPSPRLSCRLFGAPGLRLLSVGLALGLAVPAAALPTIVTSTTSTVALDLPAVTPIFVPTARYPCFRQPALLAVGDKLLAFAENRNVSACAPEAAAAAGKDRAEAGGGAEHPEEVGSLLLRTSADGGFTWGPMQTITTGNIDFYSMVYDAKRDKVTVLLAQHGVAVLTSADRGATWTSRAALDTKSLSRGDMAVKGPAVGHGIQLSAELCATQGGCQEAGRLVIPMVCTNKTASGSHGDRGCVTCNACLLLSDDGAKTWRLGAVGQQGTRESQVAQLPSNTAHAALFATERNMGTQPGHRAYALSADGGASYDLMGTDDTLTAPVTAHWTGIVGSVVAVDNGTTLVYSGPSSSTLRQDMALHTSHDGLTWSKGKTLWAGFAGYSDMAVVHSGNGQGAHVVLILENGKTSFADYVSVASIPLTWLPPQP